MKLHFSILFILIFSACSQVSREPLAPVRAPDAEDHFSAVRLHEEKPLCLAMVNQFCSTLYSAKNQGEMRFRADQTDFHIKMGRTQNGFSQADYEFMSSQLKVRTQFPIDLKDSLSYRGFFDKMKIHLARTSIQNMNLESRLKSLRDEDEVGFIWNLSMKETVLKRMEKEHPGFSSIRESLMPLELRYEMQRENRRLKAEIANALWSNHANWQKVRRKFARIRNSYLSVIAQDKNLPPRLKKEWLSRIQSVKLVVPGSDFEEDMDDCFRSESNAYYFTLKNEITVCAGDFNSEEIEQTLAHELGHALDLDRSRYLFQSRSSLGRELESIRSSSCGKKNFRCEDWNHFKSEFTHELSEWVGYHPELPAFNSCLNDEKPLTPIPDDYVKRVAKESVADVLSRLAQDNVFLRIISPELPLIDGSLQPNPTYLNPCGYYLWKSQAKSLEDEMSVLLFFSSEYRCSAEKDPEEKFRKAIDLAQSFQEKLTRAKILMEGEFSDRERLMTDGYSSSPVERFADAVGQKVFARILKQEPKLAIRRARYLANNAWLCSRPSIQKLYPKETGIQRDYYSEAHSEKLQRQKELLTGEIRDVLDCRPDFTAKACGF